MSPFFPVTPGASEMPMLLSFFFFFFFLFCLFFLSPPSPPLSRSAGAIPTRLLLLGSPGSLVSSESPLSLIPTAPYWPGLRCGVSGVLSIFVNAPTADPHHRGLCLSCGEKATGSDEKAAGSGERSELQRTR